MKWKLSCMQDGRCNWKGMQFCRHADIDQQHCSVTGSLALISLVLLIILPPALCFPSYKQWVVTCCWYKHLWMQSSIHQIIDHFMIGSTYRSSNQELQTKYNFTTLILVTLNAPTSKCDKLLALKLCSDVKMKIIFGVPVAVISVSV